MKNVILCAATALALTGCGNADKQRETMVSCAGYLQVFAGSDLYNQMQESDPETAAKVMPAGQAGGAYAQQIEEPARVQRIVSDAMAAAQRDVQSGDLRAATKKVRSCDRTLSRLAR